MKVRELLRDTGLEVSGPAELIRKNQQNLAPFFTESFVEHLDKSSLREKFILAISFSCARGTFMERLKWLRVQLSLGVTFCMILRVP